MEIIELTARNIKSISAISIKPNGAPVVEISGKNEAGKSTVLDLIPLTLEAKKVKDRNPIKRGEKVGDIYMVLGNDGVPKYKIEKVYFAGGRTSLKVESADGATVYKTPAKLLGGLFSDFTFEPMKFVNGTPKEQADALLAVIDFPFDLKEFQKISGVVEGTAASEPLAVMATIKGIVFEARTDANRELKVLKQVTDSIEITEGATVEEIDVPGLMAKRNKFHEDQLHRVEIIKAQEQAVFNKEWEEKRIKETEAELADRRGKVLSLQGESEKLIKEIETSPERTEEIAAVDAQILKASENAHLAEQIKLKHTGQVKVESAQAKWDGLDARIKAIDAYKDNLMNGLKMPVKGLGFDDEGFVTMDGIPLSQRGTSQKIIIGLKVGAAANKELKILRIDDGNALDSKNKELMLEWAAANGYVTWISIVKDEPGETADGVVAIYIEDGAVLTPEKAGA